MKILRILLGQNKRNFLHSLQNEIEISRIMRSKYGPVHHVSIISDSSNVLLSGDLGGMSAATGARTNIIDGIIA